VAVSLVQLDTRKALLKRGIWALAEQGKSLESLLVRLVENVEGQAESMLAAVFLYEQTRNDLTIAAAPNLQPVYKKAVNGFKCGPQQPACGSAVFKRQRVICRDVRTDPLWKSLRQVAESIGIRAVWSQPILAPNGMVIGTIAFYLAQPKAPDSCDVIVLETAASIAAEIIEARKDEARILINAEVEASELRHQCLIYNGAPSSQLPMFASLVRQKLAEGWRCLYLNRPPMVAGLRSSLAAIGVDVAAEVTERRLILSSDSTAAASGSFDINQMLGFLENGLTQSIADGFKGLWASGDMSWEFGAENNFAKLLEYEYQLEKLFRRKPRLWGICQYHRDSLPVDALRHGLLSHRSIFINETLSRTNPHYLPSGCLEDCKVSNRELDQAIGAVSLGMDLSRRLGFDAECSQPPCF